ncbi:hypothetical protein NP233_g10152 [Leucocoprinus birnbaumii]|uniref:Uncharacterized protein n=1 Tax=Leucocoprinus birnbaumii TaxID=56174 RepID=A0AAD5YS60_9AGAR|nr:hypothetical protein NP233_g10152 [Leucocoprinus birnbaumii]
MAENSNALLQAASRTEVVTLTTVEGTLYGLSFALYLTCCRLLLLELSKDKGRRRQNLFTLSYMSLIMIFGLLTLAVDTEDLAFVDYMESLKISFLHHNDSQFDAPAVYRLALIVEMSDVVGHRIFTTSQDRVLDAVRQGLTMLTALIVTSLISGRIAFVRRTHVRTMGKSDISNQYLSIISMLVESFALEFIWTTITIGTSLSNGVGIIAYLLVVYRVSTGRGWKRDTEEKLTTLQWNRDGLQTTQLTTAQAQASILISGDAPDTQA